MPAKCRGSSRSPRTAAPSRTTVTGIRKVTSSRIGGAGGGKDAEIKDVGQRRRQQRQAGQSAAQTASDGKAGSVHGCSTTSMIGKINTLLAVT